MALGVILPARRAGSRVVCFVFEGLFETTLPFPGSSMIALTVTRERAGLRLDRFLALELTDFSRVRLQTLIRGGFVRLNGKPPRPRDPVRSGDIVELTEPAIEKIEARPEEMALEVLFEDDDLLVLNKPAGLVMHPGAGHQQHTLVNA